MADLLKVKAIVTRAVVYRETDLILTLVSLEYGKISATLRGCLKPNAKLRYCGQPMNFGEYMLAVKGNRYIVTDCSQIESFLDITLDLSKFYSASFILELLQKVSVESQPEIFASSLRHLYAMAFEDAPASETATDFILDVLSISGYNLDFSVCQACKCTLTSASYYSSSNGIVCEHCKEFSNILIDPTSRAYIAGDDRNIQILLKNKSNILLNDFVYSMLGVRIATHYFTELI